MVRVHVGLRVCTWHTHFYTYIVFSCFVVSVSSTVIETVTLASLARHAKHTLLMYNVDVFCVWFSWLLNDCSIWQSLDLATSVGTFIARQQMHGFWQRSLAEPWIDHRSCASGNSWATRPPHSLFGYKHRSAGAQSDELHWRIFLLEEGGWRRDRDAEGVEGRKMGRGVPLPSWLGGLGAS